MNDLNTDTTPLLGFVDIAIVDNFIADVDSVNSF